MTSLVTCHSNLRNSGSFCFSALTSHKPLQWTWHRETFPFPKRKTQKDAGMLVCHEILWQYLSVLAKDQQYQRHCVLPKPQVAQVALQLYSQSPRGHCPLNSITWLTLAHFRSAACCVCPILFVDHPLGTLACPGSSTDASNQEVSTV